MTGLRRAIWAGAALDERGITLLGTLIALGLGTTLALTAAQALVASHRSMVILSAKAETLSLARALELHLSTEPSCSRFFSGRTFSGQGAKIPASPEEEPLVLLHPDDPELTLAAPGMTVTPHASVREVRVFDIQPNGTNRWVGKFLVHVEMTNGTVISSAPVPLDLLTTPSGGGHRIEKCASRPIAGSGGPAGGGGLPPPCDWYGFKDTGPEVVVDHGTACGGWTGFYDHCICPEGRTMTGLDRCLTGPTSMMFCRCCG